MRSHPWCWILVVIAVLISAAAGYRLFLMHELQRAVFAEMGQAAGRASPSQPHRRILRDDPTYTVSFHLPSGAPRGSDTVCHRIFQA